MLVDGVTELVDRGPLLLGIRQRDARRFKDARDRHLDIELAFAIVDHAADRRGALWVGRGGERNVSLAREQAAGRVETDPTGTGKINFAPRVQVGEIFFRAAGAVE